MRGFVLALSFVEPNTVLFSQKSSRLPFRFPTKLIDWCETLLGAGHNDAPGLILNAVTVIARTICYGSPAGLGFFKRDIE